MNRSDQTERVDQTEWGDQTERSDQTERGDQTLQGDQRDHGNQTDHGDQTDQALQGDQTRQIFPPDRIREGWCENCQTCKIASFDESVSQLHMIISATDAGTSENAHNF